ncbi:MAG: DUF2924 domain-containing protein [Oceanicaulis sp.]
MARDSVRDIDLDLDRLPDRSRDELADLWRSAFAADPPAGMSRALLARLLAYDLQAARRGGLTQRVRARLAKIRAGDAPQPSTPKLKPGARLVREWNGISHTVDVTETGFVYRGESWRSLTAIAKAITGTRWSGPRFFGLKGKAR